MTRHILTGGWGYWSSVRYFLDCAKKNPEKILSCFIFDGCHRSWVTATPVIYERDIQWVTSLFTMVTNWEMPEQVTLLRTAPYHYSDVLMGAKASQSNSLTIVYSTVYSGTDQRIHQNSALLAFVRGIHRWPVNSPRKGPVTRKMIPFDDVIMFGDYVVLNCIGSH